MHFLFSTFQAASARVLNLLCPGAKTLAIIGLMNLAALSPVQGEKLQLSWRAPTSNTDGSPLLDLIGYEIHWGRKGQDLEYTNYQAGADTKGAVNINIPGTWSLCVKAVNSSNRRSDCSNLVETEIMTPTPTPTPISPLPPADQPTPKITPTLEPTPRFSTPPNPDAPVNPSPQVPLGAKHDINGDGIAEVISSLIDFRQDSLRHNIRYGPLGTASKLEGIVFGSATDTSAFSDYDGDSLTDIAVMTGQRETLRWLIQPSSGGGIQEVPLGVPADWGISGCDFTGDARSELAGLNVEHGLLYYRSLTDETLQAFPFPVQPNEQITELACADLDGDLVHEIAAIVEGSPSARTPRLAPARLRERYLFITDNQGQQLFKRRLPRLGNLSLFNLPATARHPSALVVHQSLRGQHHNLLIFDWRRGAYRISRQRLPVVRQIVPYQLTASESGGDLRRYLMVSRNRALILYNPQSQKQLRLGRLAAGESLLKATSLRPL